MNPTTDESFRSDLFRDDDLGSIIRVHLHIEYHINDILDLLVPYPEDLKPIQLDYDGKVNLICALGVQPERIKILKALGTMRNKFAHNLNFKLDNSNVKSLYESLDSSAKEILQSSHNLMRSKEQHKGVAAFNKLTVKDQFILIAVVVRHMLLRIIDELKNTVQQVTKRTGNS